MTKRKIVAAFRMNKEESKKLKALAKYERRNISQMLRLLIERAYYTVRPPETEE